MSDCRCTSCQTRHAAWEGKLQVIRNKSTQCVHTGTFVTFILWLGHVQWATLQCFVLWTRKPWGSVFFDLHVCRRPPVIIPHVLHFNFVTIVKSFSGLLFMHGRFAEQSVFFKSNLHIAFVQVDTFTEGNSHTSAEQWCLPLTFTVSSFELLPCLKNSCTVNFCFTTEPFQSQNLSVFCLLDQGLCYEFMINE